MAKAARSMPSGRRPAARAALRTCSIMSRRAATSSTRWRWPSGVSTTSSGWKSRMALSTGIGISFCAENRTAASNSLRSPITGSWRMRTTIFWLATPMRTRLSRSLRSAKSVRSALARPSTSATSPSRTMPGSSATVCACCSEMEPLTETAAAWTPLGSISTPTTVFLLVRFAIAGVLGRWAGSLERRTRRNALEALEVGIHEAVAHEEREDGAHGEERAERHGGLPAGLAAEPGHDHGAHCDARDEAEEDGRGDRPPKVQAEHGDELDVAHAHALRV